MKSSSHLAHISENIKRLPGLLQSPSGRLREIGPYGESLIRFLNANWAVVTEAMAHYASNRHRSWLDAVAEEASKILTAYSSAQMFEAVSRVPASVSESLRPFESELLYTRVVLQAAVLNEIVLQLTLNATSAVLLNLIAVADKIARLSEEHFVFELSPWERQLRLRSEFNYEALDSQSRFHLREKAEQEHLNSAGSRPRGMFRRRFSDATSNTDVSVKREQTYTHQFIFSCISASIASLIVAHAVVARSGTWISVLLFFLLVFEQLYVLSEIFISGAAGQRRLLALDYTKSGIPRDSRTLIAIPVVLQSKSSVRAALDVASANFIIANDSNVSVALVADFGDAKLANFDVGLLELLVDGIDELNRRHFDHQPFLALFRPSRYSKHQRVWTGRERKRGKLHDLNRLLLGRWSALKLVAGDPAAIPGFKYVMCIDDDAVIARNSIQKLVGTIDHPLNEPVCDNSGRVVRGHAAVVPMVVVNPEAAGLWQVPGMNLQTAYVNFKSAPEGRNLLFDILGTCHYPGKCLYNIEAYEKSLVGLFPKESILSHDTVEGPFLRPGWVGDAVVTESFPRGYLEMTIRQHRWTRGDVQNLWWIASSWSKDKLRTRRELLTYLVGNQVRAALTPLMIFSLLVLWGATNAAHLASCLIALALVPMLKTYQQLSKVRVGGLLGGVSQTILGLPGVLWLRVSSAPIHSVFAVDAVVLASWRLLTRRNRLQWTPWRSVESSGYPFRFRLYYWGSPLAAALVCVLGPGRWSAPSLALTTCWLTFPILAKITVIEPSADIAR